MTSDLHVEILAELDDYERAMPQPGDLIDALRAAVELHKPDFAPPYSAVCSACGYCDACGTTEPYPCSTIRTIAQQLGVLGGPADE